MGETEQTGEERANRLVWAAWLVPVLAAVYVLSPMPLFAVVMLLGLESVFEPFLTVVYAPLAWASENCRPIYNFYEWQGELFGLW